MKLFYFASFVLLLLVIESRGLKILGVLPFGSKSHWFVGHAIIKSLVDAGHEATVLTPYPLKDPIKNYREIDIASVLDVFRQGDMEKHIDSAKKVTHFYIQLF